MRVRLHGELVELHSFSKSRAYTVESASRRLLVVRMLEDMVQRGFAHKVDDGCYRVVDRECRAWLEACLQLMDRERHKQHFSQEFARLTSSLNFAV